MLCLGLLALCGASYRTSNYAVQADSPEVAQQIGEAAEKYRKRIAYLWLGQELADWSEPCVLEVRTPAHGRRGGYSTFYFDQGRVLGQQLHITGTLTELLPKVLPHEVTHSVLAHYFGCPVPRWADEGTAILSEDDAEKNRRDVQMLHILSTSNEAYPLDELFDLSHYPRDLRVFYTQSYSITRFLVDRSDRRTFLQFLSFGMRYSWDRAVRAYYGYHDVAALERAWKKRLHFTQFRIALVQVTQPLADRAGVELDNLRRTSLGLLRSLEPVAVLPLIRMTEQLAKGWEPEGHFAISHWLPPSTMLVP